MGKFLVTLEVDFDPTAWGKDGIRHKVKAPRRWRVFDNSWIGNRWMNGVKSIKIVSMTDPVLTPDEEKGMEEDWVMKNHGLD